MAKTKTKGTSKTVSDTPVPQPITISSTNPKIMADNIKKLEKAIKGADDASEISYDNTESHLTASNVQVAIDEVVSGLTSPAAEDVTYDNTSSELTADDVQGAIDELSTSIDNLTEYEVENMTSASLTISLKKIGNVVIGTIGDGSVTASAEDVVATFPEGWVPHSAFVYDFMDSYAQKRFTISASGLTSKGALTAQIIRGSFIYFI